MRIHSLAAITSLARSGALERAWSLFEAEGRLADPSPAALAVKGRLLKDRARRAGADERGALLAEAEAAYAAADAAVPAPYLLINVATLAALRGDAGRAAGIAREVIARLAGPDVAETPYYIAATRAEALLLAGDPAGADRALGEAAALHPDGWEDRATTLRQLALILETQGASADWLDAHRPPAGLHFAGHLGVAQDAAGLRAEIDALLGAHRIGLGFGALAAGADITIAEALLARGAELHVVLPCSVEGFARNSVAAFGEGWLPRFHACLAAAASVRIAAQAERAHEPLATALAAEAAMGAAMLHARRHETRAVQILVIDEGAGAYGSGPNTARDGRAWAATGAAQHPLRWPRDASAPPPPAEGDRADRRLMALLRVAAADPAIPGEDDFARWLDEVLAPLKAAAAALVPPPAHIVPDGNGLLLAFATPAEAAEAARALQALAPLRIAGTYGIVHVGGGDVTGTPVATAEAMLAAAPGGATVVTDLFASALALHGGEHRAEAIGEHDLAGIETPVPLFALTR